MSNIKDLGKIGESISYNYLKSNHYEILKRNYHSPYGEIDIIAKSRDTLIFVEVKTRSSTIEKCKNSVSNSKQKKIIKTANYFLSKNHHYYELFTRFDVICIIAKNPEFSIHHLKDAFTP